MLNKRRGIQVSPEHTSSFYARAEKPLSAPLQVDYKQAVSNASMEISLTFPISPQCHQRARCSHRRGELKQPFSTLEPLSPREQTSAHSLDISM